jgi:hypothetical protein
LTVRPESVASQGCSGTAVIGIYADAINNNDALTDAKIVLEVQHTGGVTFASSYFGVCNNPNSTATCSVTPQTTSPNAIRIEIELDAINVSIGPSFGPQLLGTLTFSGLESCIEGVVFRDGVVEHASGNVPCFATLQTNIAPGTMNTGDDLCFSDGIITAVDRNGLKIDDFTYYANYHPANTTNCPKTDHIDSPPASFCTCNMKETEQDMVLYSFLDPLNGVDAWDLVLISRHILNLQPLTGFLLLAADANMSGHVTTLDNVDIRKLILGTILTLPDANSWRFMDKNLQSDIIGGSINPFEIIGYDMDQVCQNCPNISAINSPNQFTTGEFSHYMLPSGSQDNLVEFIGFKVGDVSGNAVPNNFQSLEDRNLNTLATGQTTVHGKKGEIVQIVIAAKEAQQLAALQMALGFDAGAVAVEDVRWALPVDEYSATKTGWNIATPGELRLLWFDALDGFPADKEMPLCYIKVKLLRDIAAEIPLFTKMDNKIESLCYSPAGVAKTIALDITDRAALKPAPVVNSNVPTPLKIYPNPASGLFRIEAWSDMEAAAVLTITDATGRTVVTRSIKLVAGLNTVTSRQFPILGIGQYEVRLETEKSFYTARLIKQQHVIYR